MPKTRPTFRPAIRYIDPATGKPVDIVGKQWYDVHAELFERVPDPKLRQQLIDQDAKWFEYYGSKNKPSTPAGFVDERNNFYTRDQAYEIAEHFQKLDETTELGKNIPSTETLSKEASWWRNVGSGGVSDEAYATVLKEGDGFRVDYWSQGMDLNHLGSEAGKTLEEVIEKLKKSGYTPE